MAIKQKTILTEGEKQGIPTSLESVFPLFGVGKYQPKKEGENYFIVAYDDPPITKNVIIGIGPQTSEFDMYGNEIGTDIEVKEGQIQYTKRSFYLYKTLNGEVQKIDNLYDSPQEIAFINIQIAGSAVGAKNLDLGKLQVIDNEFFKTYLKNRYSFSYDPKNYLVLGPMAKKQPDDFENLCDIILAETIKSYLL